MSTFSGETQQPRKRGRPRDPGADERILKAASALMLERGYDAMTVDDIAAQAHVGKATVYRRWASKDDLAVAAMETLYEAEFEVPDTGSIRSDLIEAYRSVLSFANTPTGRAYLRTLISESMRDPKIADLSRASTARSDAAAHEMFERAAQRGELRDDLDHYWAVNYLYGLVASALTSSRRMPTVDEAETLVEFVLSGVGTKK